MFGMGMGEIVLIAVVALLVLGPERLPGAAKAIGKGIRDLRQQTKSLQNTIELDTEIGDAVREIRGALRGDPETLYKKATGDDWHGDESKMPAQNSELAKDASDDGASSKGDGADDASTEGGAVDAMSDKGESIAKGTDENSEPEKGTDRTLKALNLLDDKYADTDDGWGKPVSNPHDVDSNGAEKSDDSQDDPDLPKILPAGGTMARNESVEDEFSKDTGSSKDTGDQSEDV